MPPQDYFGSDQQPRNQLLKNDSSTISFRQCPSSNLSHSNVPMPNQNRPYLPRSNPTNSGTSVDESSLITCLDSSLHGGSFSKGFGFNHEGSPASISGDSTVDQLSAHGPHFSVTDHQGSVPPPVMMFNNLNKLPLLDDMQFKHHHEFVMNPKKLRQQRNPLQQQQNPLQQQQNPLQQQQNPHQQQRNPRQQQRNPRQQQRNPCQQVQNPYQQQQNPCQRVQNPYQQQQNPSHQQQNPYHQQQNPYQQQQNAQQLLPHLAVQPQQPANAGLAVKSLISYVHHRRNKPLDNNIGYWRSFVKKLYSPHVKKTTCYSSYDRLGHHAYKDFTHVKTWKCGSCGSTSGKGFVETFDVIPRMNQLYFNSNGGVINELLLLDMLSETNLPGGFVMVRSQQAVQESVYSHCHVIHKGVLTVIFNPQLQITLWNFCVQNHEVLLSNNLIASQANSLINNATRYKTNDDPKGRDEVERQNLLSNASRAAHQKLVATVRQSHVCELGLSKHFVRSLKTSEVLDSMKGLMDISQNDNTSPIETLKRYAPRQSSNVTRETRCMESRSAMQQAPGPPAQSVHVSGKTDHSFQTANYMAQAPNNNPHSRHRNPSMAEEMVPGLCASPSPYSRAQGSLVPSSGQTNISNDGMLLDILAHMQSGETTKRVRSDDTRVNLPGGEQKRCRVECSSQVNNELGTDHNSILLDGKSENGTALDSSCNSNSPKLFPDCDFLKDDGTGFDDDLMSSEEFVEIFLGDGESSIIV